MAKDEPIPIDDQSHFLRHIVDSSPELLHTARPDGYADFFNQTWLDFTGLPLEKLLGWGWTGRIHPDYVDCFLQNMRESLAKAKPFRESSRVRRADGVYRWMLHRIVPRFDGNGQLIRWHGSGVDIDDQKRAEEQLVKSGDESRRSEAYLAEAQRLSHTGSFGWNPDSGEIVWSDETYRIFEVDSGTKPTLDMLVERIHRQDRALFEQVINRASQTCTDFEHEYRLQLADGRVKHVYAIAHALQDASGTREFIGAVTDITERKTAEEKILRNERELRTLIDVMPAYVGTSLPDGTVDFLSQSWLDYSGQTREEAMGWGWTGLMHPDDADRVLANWQTGLASGEPVEQEFRCRSADGTYHWFLNHSLPLHDDEGNIVKWYGILFDINSLKETEHALQAREHQLLGIIETIPTMLWSISSAGETTHLSQRVLKYCGAPLEELVNRGWERFLHPDDREETLKAFAGAMSSGESYSVIHRVRRADGVYRWHHSMGEPLRDPHGAIIQWYGVAIDIDERKRAEDHLRDTRIKLNTASRIATVAELSASIAHELNQPLTAVLGNALAAKRWLAATPPDLTETIASIERILRDIRLADQTMQHIRALFKSEPYEKRDESVQDILRESLRFVHDGPPKHELRIDWSIEDGLRPICVDRIQVQQVFINLISNAIEATDGSANTARILLRAFVAKEDEVVVQVVDNGTGIENTERIFDAFMTTKEKGMGIGLAVSRSIVEAHGGRIWAENNPGGGGATFNVALPLASKHEAR